MIISKIEKYQEILDAVVEVIPFYDVEDLENAEIDDWEYLIGSISQNGYEWTEHDMMKVAALLSRN